MMELMVVLMIFALLTMMAAPKISLSPAKTRAGAAMTGSTLMAAERAAVSRQHNVVVAFDATLSRIRVHFDTNNDGTVQSSEHTHWEPLPEGVVFGRAGAPAGRAGSSAISFRGRESGYPALFFLRSGIASEEGGFYLTTAGDQARSKSINVRMVVIDRATGRPSWSVYTGSAWKTEF